MTDLDKKALLKQIDRINSTPTPKKWRMAHDFARKNNPEVRFEQDLYKKDLRTLRESQQNKYGSSTKSGLRFGVSIPQTTVTAIRAFDPMFLMEDKDRQSVSHKSNDTVRTLAKMFPEYKVYKEI